jgi:hypothetical protein
MKSGNLNFLEPSGPLWACNGTDLPLCMFDTSHTNAAIPYVLVLYYMVDTSHTNAAIPYVLVLYYMVDTSHTNATIPYVLVLYYMVDTSHTNATIPYVLVLYYMVHTSHTNVTIPYVLVLYFILVSFSKLVCKFPQRWRQITPEHVVSIYEYSSLSLQTVSATGFLSFFRQHDK